MSQLLVSVIIPARNAASTLAQTLDSLLAQSYQAWEAIVIDDASSDATRAIAEQYAKSDLRFRVFAGTYGSASAARNAGLAVANGRWLHFLDADDWVDPTFFAKMLAALSRTPNAIAAYCGYQRVMPDGGRWREGLDHTVAEAPAEAFAGHCAVAIHAVLVERTAVVDLGGFDVTLQTCEDWELWQRLSRLDRAWVEVAETLAFYRTGAISLSRNPGQMLRDARTVIARGLVTNIPLESEAARLWATPEASLGCFALWSAAASLGASWDWLDEDILRGVPTGDPRPVAEIILEGLAIGQLVTPERMAAHMQGISSGLDALFDRLASAWGDPSATRRVRSALEQLTLENIGPGDSFRVGRRLGLQVDVCNPRPLDLPEGVDTLHVQLTRNGKVQWVVILAALGRMSSRQWTRVILDYMWPGALMKAMLRGGRFTLIPFVIVMALAVVARSPRLLASRHGLKVLKDKALRHALLMHAGLRDEPQDHASRLSLVESRAWAEAWDLAVPSPAQAQPQAPEVEQEAPPEDRRAFWDEHFGKEDPWDYGSPYEQEKYARQLAVLPPEPPKRAMELACAEGMFTPQLAGRVAHLLATDISAKALERARARCAGMDNIDFQVVDLASDDIPHGLDLIVCSEVLYYLHDKEELSATLARIVARLVPGGSLICAHSFVLGDDETQAGFNWDAPFGAKIIHEMLAAMPELQLQHSIVTDIYRIDRFARVGAGVAMAPVIVENLALETELSPEVARQIIWKDGPSRRSERWRRIPVLMYHGVGEEGPEGLARYRTSKENFTAQMSWLQANSYHTLSPSQLLWHLESKRPFYGWPIVLTFDDGFKDFAQAAWPILAAHNFTAEVFVVTDLVGRTAEWDAKYGEATPLMDVEEILTVAKMGAGISSHLATHRAIDELSSQELAEELARSRAFIARWTEETPIAFATPFSIPDGRLSRMARECGYKVGFGERQGFATLDDNPIDLPRIEVRGDFTLEDFIQAVEGPL